MITAPNKTKPIKLEKNQKLGMSDTSAMLILGALLCDKPEAYSHDFICNHLRPGKVFITDIHEVLQNVVQALFSDRDAIDTSGLTRTNAAWTDDRNRTLLDNSITPKDFLAHIRNPGSYGDGTRLFTVSKAENKAVANQSTSQLNYIKAERYIAKINDMDERYEQDKGFLFPENVLDMFIGKATKDRVTIDDFRAAHPEITRNNKAEVFTALVQDNPKQVAESLRELQEIFDKDKLRFDTDRIVRHVYKNGVRTEKPRTDAMFKDFYTAVNDSNLKIIRRLFREGTDFLNQLPAPPKPEGNALTRLFKRLLP